MNAFVSESSALHPSTFIAEEMRERGWSIDRLAIAMGSNNTDFMKGVGINNLALDLYLTLGPNNPDIILGDTMPAQLAVAFGTSVDFWTNIERAWRESLQPTPANKRPPTRAEVMAALPKNPVVEPDFSTVTTFDEWLAMRHQQAEARPTSSPGCNWKCSSYGHDDECLRDAWEASVALAKRSAEVPA